MHPIARFLFIYLFVTIWSSIYSSCICSCWPCPTVWSTLFGKQQPIRFICMFCGNVWAQREKNIVADPDRCKGSILILFKGEKNYTIKWKYNVKNREFYLYWCHEPLWNYISLRMTNNLNLNECFFLSIDHYWFLYSLIVILETCHNVYRNLIVLNSSFWFPNHLILLDWE